MSDLKMKREVRKLNRDFKQLVEELNGVFGHVASDIKSSDRLLKALVVGFIVLTIYVL